MNRDDAKSAVLAQLRRRMVGGPAGVLIIDSETIDKPYGWIFFYNSRKFVETGDIFQSLVGHGPVIVLAGSGEIIELGSVMPPELAIAAVEQERGLGSGSG